MKAFEALSVAKEKLALLERKELKGIQEHLEVSVLQVLQEVIPVLVLTCTHTVGVGGVLGAGGGPPNPAGTEAIAVMTLPHLYGVGNSSLALVGRCPQCNPVAVVDGLAHRNRATDHPPRSLPMSLQIAIGTGNSRG